MPRKVKIIDTPESKYRFRNRKRRVKITHPSKFEIMGARERREWLWRQILKLWEKVKDFQFHVVNFWGLVFGVLSFCGIVLVVLLEYSLIPVYLTEWKTSPTPNFNLVDLAFWFKPLLHLAFGFCTTLLFAWWCYDAIIGAIEPTAWGKNPELIERIRLAESGEKAYSYDGMKPPCPICRTPMLVSARREYKFTLTCPRCRYEAEYKLKEVKV